MINNDELDATSVWKTDGIDITVAENVKAVFSEK